MKKHLPNDWKEFILKDIGISYNGLTNKNASNFKNNCNAKYITYKSIYDCNKIDIKRLEHVHIEENEKQNLVQYGDAFFTISSETPDEVAISSVLLDEVENTYLNSFCFGFRFDFNILVPEFARYYFRSNYIRKYTYKLAQGSTRFNLSKNKFLEMIIKLPTIDEQKRIANILSTFDDLIENLTKLIEKKEIYKKGVMQRVLSGKVRFNGFEDDWETVRLGDIATITSAGVDKKINDNETKVRLLNYLDVFNRNKLYDNEISFITSANENQIKKCDIKKGDLFITPSSEDREGIAKSAVAMEDFTNVVYSYHIIRLRFNREIDLKFKSYMCDTALFHRQAYRLCDGSGQRYVISLGTFREMEIYIPKSVEEQKKIGELLSLIDQDIDNLKQLLHLRKLQKKGLMQKLLTGEVRI